MGQFSFHRRAQFLERLKREVFDVLILGGGINGTGVLRDLCLRRPASGHHRFALIEKDHFASSASSKNSQLIHGGLRYLKYFDFSLVQEALRERAILLRVAPHGAWAQPFLLPVYQAGKQWYYRTGIKLYECLSGSAKLGKSVWLGTHRALQEEPNLNPEKLRGAVVFWDAQMHAPRLVLDQLRESVERGAVALNFVQAVDPIQQSGQIKGVRARDQLSGDEFFIRAHTIVHTVGPWEKDKPLRLVRGSHLIFPQLTKGRRALAFFDEQGRILFVIPYGPGGRFSLVGTTEKAQEHAESVHMDAGEQDYLIEQVKAVLPGTQFVKPKGSYSALRPLLPAPRSRSLSAISRRHRIWKSEPNVYHLNGGKWTTFRLMAEELVDLLAREHLPELGPCCTAKEAVDGNTEEALRELHANVRDLSREYGLPLTTVKQLVRDYGRRTFELLSICRETEWKKPLVPPSQNRELPYIYAQMAWAAENEMTARLRDFLTISTPLQYMHRFSRTARKELESYFEIQ